MKLLAASWAVPVESPPVEGGALLVSGGRILAVGRASDLAREWPGAKREDYGGHVLFPALVNAHAHLELTGLGDAFAGDGFAGSVLEVVRRKRRADLSAYSRGIEEGARRCRLGGQGLVADVLSVAAAASSYPADGVDVAIFPEVIAPLSAPSLPEIARSQAGLSPHSPYTVGAEAYRACARAVGNRGRLMTHAAESPDEVEFCLRGRGDLVARLYGGLGLEPPPAPGMHPVDWLHSLGVLGPRALLVHCVHVTPNHIELLRRSGCGVVLCPRSNRALGVGTAPGRALLDAGVPVALGTDSVLSAGDLDLWQDALRAVEDYGWSPEEALRAATSGGARVLGVGTERGGFVPGGRADILALPFASGRNLWEQILSGGAGGAQRWVG